ncbi:MAG: PH domain-containing protein [Bacteroidetes bacterium]|nr:PH domain-containing protein [Bacteroidota bacterium]MDA0904275.1 PH domain-containing protein [Bacteroidota bacterium]MDA1241863.1 PH domain-containing protein [Bacteroidota bacterium]
MTDVRFAFEVPRRQHAVGLLVLVGWQAQKMLRAAWPILLAAYVQQEEDAKYFAWALAAGAVLTVVGAVLHFWRFSFNVKEGKFHVHKGVLVREKINIPLERVQAVHVEQNLIQRAFGVCGLRVDTAGSSGSELRIHALKWAEAQALREMLTAEDEPVEVPNESTPESEQPSTTRTTATRSPLLELDVPTLLKVGLSQNHLAKVAFAIGGVVTFQGVAWEVVAELWAKVPGLWRTILLFLSPLLLVISPVVIATVAVAISLVTSVLKHWQMRLWVEGSRAKRTAALHLTQGLLNRQSMQIPLHKVQWVMWESTWIRRLFSMDTVHIRQAAAGGAVDASQSGNGGMDGGGGMKMGIPAMNSKRTRRLEALLFPSWPERRLVTLRPVKYAFWIRWVKRGLILTPLAVGAGWALGLEWGMAMGAMCWSWVGWLSRKVHRGQWATTDGRHLSAHRGWLFRRRVMIDWTKLQAVELTQNRIHARRGVAHLTFHTSSGVAQLSYLPEAQARQLRDLAVSRVVSQQGPWM